MGKKDSRIKKLRETLVGLDRVSTIVLIRSLRDEKPFFGLLSMLAELHSSTSDDGVRDEVELFFNDLKEQSVAGEVVSIIDHIQNNSTRNVLLSSCWQSGIDYSGYIEYFVSWAISGDYFATLECFTTIEQSAFAVPANKRDEEARRIISVMGSVSGDKVLLMKEIISILQH